MNKMDFGIKNQTDLFKRVKPALISKENELKRIKKGYIKSGDVWNYLIKHKWKQTTNLSLYDMVDDILNIDNDLLDKYIKSKENKEDIKDEIELL